MVFGSRKRATSNPPRRTGVPTTPSNPATLAALQGATRAFVKPASNGLSSAAAAAALKANPTVPTQPGELQTKRMVRRGSNSSMASAPGNLAPRHSISRQNSNASMSERSFRAQSPDPNRHNSLSISNGLHKHAPPVPAIPKNLQESAFRRSMSIEPPQRNHRGVNVDRGLGSSIHSSPADRTMSLTGTDREEARLSINFSRPMSPPIPPVMSDSPSSHKGHSGWFTEPVTISRSPRNATHAVLPNSTATDYENAQQLIRNAAETPVTKKQYASATEGTHLAKGGMQAKPTGTAVQVQKPASPTTRSPATSQPVNTVADQPPVHLEGGVQRTTSVSPARSARFLDTS
ncbi:hypothetical protein EJ05DRAFT_325875 [Pseudovirgaria hyperparasitica]|uniref:Uncharacterized protein n=1 Tax=Pseudovirgaria hyperparasitica TaxID=470096 RepID=A0A6A6WAN5_9PEZI|nr:uncharacterized protein EJ05DRAFT_325875 [Pseudovirgaria hyperparasitica]KAF2758896.1 hypothetical protein EJ05DRAFT_325875 [Pseudovirgaria hyperparasitica]